MAGAYENATALRSDLDRLCSMIGGASAPQLASAAVPGLEWTADEVATHILLALTGIGETLRGSTATVEAFAAGEGGGRGSAGSAPAGLAAAPATGPLAPAPASAPGTAPGTAPAGAAPSVSAHVADFNARTIAAFKTSDPQELSTGIQAAGIAVLASAASAAPDQVCATPWYGTGSTRTAETIAAVAHGEILMHGLDIARALGRPWAIPKESAASVAYAVLAGMAPHMVNEKGRRFKASLALSLRGGRSFTVTFTDGTMTVTPTLPGSHPDCRISMDPRAVLMTGYGRASQWPYIARGQLFAYGRRPWLAARMLGCISRP